MSWPCSVVSPRTVLAVLFLGLAAPLALALEPMIDAHSHYSAADAEAFTPSEIMARLDASGVSRIVISSTPPQTAQALYREAPERVVPFLGVYSSGIGKATWMYDAAVPERVRAQLREGGWYGIGELHIFARDTRSTVLEALVRIAEEHDLILMIHGDSEIIDRVFELTPELRVLWAHLGTIPVPSLVDRTLTRHHDRALWVDTSVRDERIAPGGVLLDEWRALFERHPDRFVVAVDTFSTNRWRNYGEVVATIRGWVGTLPDELARRLLHDNAAAMLAGER